MRIVADDIKTSHRIKRAAVKLFAEQGFNVGLRTIAEEAGVSLGLIRHHFGSKEGLRTECDAFVLEEIGTAMAEQRLAVDGTAAFLAQAANLDEYRVLIDYVVRFLRAGGPTAAAFVDQVASETEVELEARVADGTVRPTADPRGRALYLTMSGLGELVLSYSLESDPEERTRMLLASSAASLELFTLGLFTDRTLLDAYLARPDANTAEGMKP